MPWNAYCRGCGLTECWTEVQAFRFVISTYRAAGEELHKEWGAQEKPGNIATVLEYMEAQAQEVEEDTIYNEYLAVFYSSEITRLQSMYVSSCVCFLQRRVQVASQ